MSFIENVQNIPWLSYATRTLAVVLVWTVVWILTRYLSRWIDRLDEHVIEIDIDSRELRALDRLLDYIIITIGIIVTLAVLGLSRLFYSALATAGVISIIVGFAAKDVAANFISGIFILLDQPFVSGDFVEIGSYSGTVRKISLRTTEIVTADGPVVTIPNSKMATEPTVNYSIAAMRMVEIKVSVPKDCDLARASQVVRDVAQSESRLEAGEDISILVEDIGEYGVDLLLRCFSPKDGWLKVRSDLRQRIVEEFQRQGLELAVPVQKSLHTDRPMVEAAAMADTSSNEA